MAVQQLTYKICLKKQIVGNHKKKKKWYEIRRKINKQLRIATKIAKVVIRPELKNKQITTKHTKKLGRLHSDIANQTIRRYKNNKKCKRITNVNLIVPAKSTNKYPNVVFDKKNNMLNIKPLRIKLRWRPPVQYTKINQVEVNNKYAFVCVSVDCLSTKSYKNVIGVDLNIRHNMAAVGNPLTRKVNYLGKGHIYERIRYKKIRERFQKQNRQSKLREFKNKEQRYTNDWNHKLASDILKLAIQSKSNISMENLLDIRKTKCFNKKFRYFLNSWPFYTLRSFVEYKSKLNGISAVFVDPKYTSQLCSSCNTINKCKSKKYFCGSCKLAIHRDENASYNIANRGYQSL